ncbi:unnamed protein product [Fusarium langsethiae]|nr:unnamed protein product [Fusarium langsethiae]
MSYTKSQYRNLLLPSRQREKVACHVYQNSCRPFVFDPNITNTTTTTTTAAAAAEMPARLPFLGHLKPLLAKFLAPSKPGLPGGVMSNDEIDRLERGFPGGAGKPVTDEAWAAAVVDAAPPPPPPSPPTTPPRKRRRGLRGHLIFTFKDHCRIDYTLHTPLSSSQLRLCLEGVSHTSTLDDRSSQRFWIYGSSSGDRLAFAFRFSFTSLLTSIAAILRFYAQALIYISTHNSSGAGSPLLSRPLSHPYLQQQRQRQRQAHLCFHGLFHIFVYNSSGRLGFSCQGRYTFLIALSSKALPTLAELCNMGMARRTTKGRPKKPKAKISRSMPSLKKEADWKRRKDTSEAPAHFAPNGLPGPLPRMIDTTDQPSFADNYGRRGDTGLTNLDICALTLGPSYSRHLSSMTTASSVPDLQQPHLAHFQIYSEHTRSGKVAFYRSQQSSLAQWKRAGLITRRSLDRNQ